MLEFLKEWAISLSGIIIFGSICETVLPNGVYKKYIHLAIGMMLIIAVIAPFTKGDVPIDDNFTYPETEYAMRGDMDKTQKEEIMRIYKKKLCEKIETELSKVAGVELDVKCQITDGEENFGEVEILWITANGNCGVQISEKVYDVLHDQFGIKKEVVDVKYIA